MFGFFLNDDFKGFWSNKPQDMFFDLTCLKMGWDKSQVTLVYYQGLKESELKHAEASKTEVKVYSVEQVQTGTETIGEGEEAYEQPIFEEQKTLIKTIQADTFYTNGLMLIPC